VAEESGKGIALVILGIVAIIAIVGLVLLFTGARKAATGEFVVTAPKEYGGAIKGVYDPYSRAFAGRAYQFPTGPQIYSGLGEEMQKVAWEVTGETGTPKAEQFEKTHTYESDVGSQAFAKACYYLSYLTTGDGYLYSEPTEESQELAARGGPANCKHVSELKAYDPTVLANRYGLHRDSIVAWTSTVYDSGVNWCCKPPRLTGVV